MNWLRKIRPQPKSHATPFWDSVRLVIVGDIILIAVVVLIGYLSKWPSIWHYGVGLLSSGFVAWIIGAFIKVSTEEIIRSHRYDHYNEYNYARSVSPVTPEQSREIDRQDMKIVNAIFWYMFLVGCVTIVLGLIVMASFPPTVTW